MSQPLTLLQGDCREVLKTLPDASVHCCVTSPPYWGLRDYGHGAQIGLEPTPQAYVETMRQVFGEVRRVLRDDGTLWLNLGDSYAGGGNYRGINSENTLTSKQSSNRGARGVHATSATFGPSPPPPTPTPTSPPTRPTSSAPASSRGAPSGAPSSTRSAGRAQPAPSRSNSAAAPSSSNSTRTTSSCATGVAVS